MSVAAALELGSIVVAHRLSCLSKAQDEVRLPYVFL